MDPIDGPQQWSISQENPLAVWPGDFKMIIWYGTIYG
jgi:hypothetical protein